MTEPREATTIKDSARFREVFCAVRSGKPTSVTDVRIERGSRFEARKIEGNVQDVAVAASVLPLSEAIALRNSLAQKLSDGQAIEHRGIGHISNSECNTSILLAGAGDAERCFALSRAWAGSQVDPEAIRTISDIDPPSSVLTPESEPDGYRVLSFRIKLPGDKEVTDSLEAAFDRCPSASFA